MGRIEEVKSTPRLPRGQAPLVILATVAFLAILPFLSPRWFIGGTAASVLLFAWALVRGGAMAVHVTLLALLVACWAALWPPGWPLSLLGPLVLYGAVSAMIPYLRKTATWLRWGRWDRTVGWLMGVTIIVSALGLLMWFFFAQPDLTPWQAAIPAGVGPPLLIIGGLGFAAVNAAVEEMVFRGVILEGLESVLGAKTPALILQAIPFGLFHVQGIPNGVTGMAMATIYGVLLGFIRRQSQGLLAPIATHFFADIVIVGLLLMTSG